MHARPVRTRSRRASLGEPLSKDKFPPHPQYPQPQQPRQLTPRPRRKSPPSPHSRDPSTSCLHAAARWLGASVRSCLGRPGGHRPSYKAGIHPHPRQPWEDAAVLAP